MSTFALLAIALTVGLGFVPDMDADQSGMAISFPDSSTAITNTGGGTLTLTGATDLGADVLTACTIDGCRTLSFAGDHTSQDFQGVVCAAGGSASSALGILSGALGEKIGLDVASAELFALRNQGSRSDGDLDLSFVRVNFDASDLDARRLDTVVACSFEHTDGTVERVVVGDGANRVYGLRQ